MKYAAQTIPTTRAVRSEEHTSELQSHLNLVCRLLLEKKKHTHAHRSPLILGWRLLRDIGKGHCEITVQVSVNTSSGSRLRDDDLRKLLLSDSVDCGRA